MARAKQIRAVRVKPLKLGKQTQSLSIPKTSIPRGRGVPVISMHGAMLNAIKQSPKGVLPPGLQKLLKGA